MKENLTCYITVLIAIMVAGCTKSKYTAPVTPPVTGNTTQLYFPAIAGTDWQTITPSSLG